LWKKNEKVERFTKISIKWWYKLYKTIEHSYLLTKFTHKKAKGRKKTLYKFYLAANKKWSLWGKTLTGLWIKGLKYDKLISW